MTKRKFFTMILALLICTTVSGCVLPIGYRSTNVQQTSSENKTKSTNESKSDISDVTTFDISTSYEDATLGEINALKKADLYLHTAAFSYEGLIFQLEFEGYLNSEATYAVDNCGADWNEQAVKKCKEYLRVSAFSYDGLIKQLTFDNFTEDEAVYGVDNCEADWNEQAVKKLKNI